MTKIYEANNHILIYTGYANPAEHSHAAAHIIVSPHSEMRVSICGTEFLCRGVMIPPGVSHLVDTGGKPALVFLCDCTSPVAGNIRQIRPIPETDCDKIAAAYFSFEQNPSSEAYRALEDSLFGQTGMAKSLCGVRDERIKTAMRHIRAHLSEKITCREAADAACLSQGRFSHLFRQQAGMTFAAYLIYQRLISAYAGILRGKTITAAALDAGFSGSSHFADTSLRVFGICASRITRDIAFSKVQ